MKGHKRSGRFGPPAAINIIRFSRKLWPKAEQERELCQALSEATFTVIGEVKDSELRRVMLGEVLDRAYEELKTP